MFGALSRIGIILSNIFDREGDVPLKTPHIKFVVSNLILDCLRYWVGTYRVDGFRFNLAAILGRNQNGSPMSNPPLLESLAHDF